MFSLTTCSAFALLLASYCTVAQDMPKVTLPWGTYQASLYDPPGDFYTFSNVRFGKAPIGDLRFQKSVFPDPIEDSFQVQSDAGSACYQAVPTACSTTSTSAASGTGSPRRDLPGLPKRPPGDPSEDCLFADLYVPASALKGTQLPIVVWIYGGGYIFGAKDAGFGYNMPLYNGTGLLRTARAQGQDFIFVTGNYRMGAFGWLAGPTMEQNGAPNAGLWDQRLLLDFAQQYVPKFGGNASSIGVWGESAGGGSILHHLTSTAPPVFSRAVMQSPAYLWQWDRSEQGYAARVFRNLTVLAGCPATGSDAFNCLQKLDAADLQMHNEAIINEEKVNTGLIPFNPAVDGSLITQLPTTAFAQRAVWENVSSFIVSHVADESKSFVPCYVKGWYDDDSVDQFLQDFFPGEKYFQERTSIKDQYSDYWRAWERVHDIIQDSSFTCNTRFVYDAYNSVSSLYMMQYNFLADYPFRLAVHASDLLPTFYNSDIPPGDFYAFINKTYPGYSPDEINELLKIEKSLSEEYQPYFASFGATGAPIKGSPTWNIAEDGDALTKVMKVSWNVAGDSDMDPNSQDDANTATKCNFWKKIAASVQDAAGAKEQKPDRNGQDVFKYDL